MWKVGVGRVGRSVSKRFAVQGTHLSFTPRPHGENYVMFCIPVIKSGMRQSQENLGAHWEASTVDTANASSVRDLDSKIKMDIS